MVDYAHKAQVLKQGLCKDTKKLDRKLYEIVSSDLNDCENVVFEEMMFCQEHQCTFYDLEEARKLNDASYKRVNRLKRRIERYLKSGQCIWLTLTFNPETLAKTSEETRRRYVARFLKTQSKHYIANIDYGDTTEREHYHAVVLCDFVDMDAWKYGFAYTERIKNHIKTSTKISKYVSKLCNHAIKETTKRAVYLYSRL